MAPKMAGLFCTSEGSRGRLPFASGEAVKVLLSSLALCPRRPDRISFSGCPAVPGLRTFQAQGGPNPAPGPALGLRQGGPSETQGSEVHAS